MKGTYFVIAVLAILLLVGCSQKKQQEANYRQISMNEAVALMEEASGYIILDVRRADEFASGHIPNAINIPNEPDRPIQFDW